MTGSPGAFGDPALEVAWNAIRDALFALPSSHDLFNPYSDRSEGLDLEDAVPIRRDNLRRYLEAYRHRPPLFLLAEAPGPWGCRFSGVPITAESQLLDPEFPLSGRQSSTEPVPHSEYSARIFWRLLKSAFPHFLVWNSVPLHPHHPGKRLTIRTPRAAELRRFESLTGALITALRPQEVVAVGRKAEAVLARLGIEACYVRHPSQGGARLFEAGVMEALARAGIQAADIHGVR